MLVPSRAGISLVELLLALVLVEFLAAATLHAALHTRRIARTLAAASATDMARLQAVRLAAAAPSCTQAPAPTLLTLSLPAEPHRPATTVQLRCGR